MKLLIKVFLLLSLPLVVSSNDNLPHKDFTIKQPKLSAHAPKKTKKGPDIFDKKFIKFEKVNFEFPFHIT